MKHKGKALSAAAAMLGKALMAVILLAGTSAFLWPKNLLLAAAFCGLGLVFSVFTLWFFRDPDAKVPSDPRSVVAPGHGKVDVIDETTEPNVMGGRCCLQRCVLVTDHEHRRVLLLVVLGGLVQIKFAGQQIDFGACSHGRRDRQHARLGRLLEHHKG